MNSIKERTLSIIIPTYNRSIQIRRTVKSLVAAELPKDLHVEVIVVDNNSQADHGRRYREMIDSTEVRLSLRYEFERKQGRSHACNRGLKVATSEWVGFIDDDEAIDPGWLVRALFWMENSHADYVGGSCIPEWEAPPPKWLPAHDGQYRGILGWIELSTRVIAYDEFAGELCGGNFIAKADLLAKVGGFDTNLGRSAGNLLGGEDGALHRRIKDAGAKGFYDPEFTILHLIPVDRMTFAYHLRWAFWSGVANGIRIEHNEGRRENVPHLFGVPRYWFSKAFRGIIVFLTEFVSFRIKSNPRGLVGMMYFFYLWGLFRKSRALRS